MKQYVAAPYGAHVLLVTSAQELRTKSRQSVAGTVGMTFWATDGTLIVYVGDGNLSTLVHECCHAVLYILEYVGIDPSASNGEPMAYLLDNMFSAFKDEI